jgi:hypothetical protein
MTSTTLNSIMVLKLNRYTSTKLLTINENCGTHYNNALSNNKMDNSPKSTTTNTMYKIEERLYVGVNFKFSDFFPCSDYIYSNV